MLDINGKCYHVLPCTCCLVSKLMKRYVPWVLPEGLMLVEGTVRCFIVLEGLLVSTFSWTYAPYGIVNQQWWLGSKWQKCRPLREGILHRHDVLHQTDSHYLLPTKSIRQCMVDAPSMILEYAEKHFDVPDMFTRRLQIDKGRCNGVSDRVKLIISHEIVDNETPGCIFLMDFTALSIIVSLLQWFTALMVPYSILRDFATKNRTEFTDRKSIEMVTLRISLYKVCGIQARVVLRTGSGFWH